mmetsp:Transcript_5021/g.7805  ORF Transcript_5021/g.7805 Transcript_5021/m.7805 type:complete len:225 (+) Transcript_5021:879-1553(+)
MTSRSPLSGSFSLSRSPLTICTIIGERASPKFDPNALKKYIGPLALFGQMPWGGRPTMVDAPVQPTVTLDLPSAPGASSVAPAKITPPDSPSSSAALAFSSVMPLPVSITFGTNTAVPAVLPTSAEMSGASPATAYADTVSSVASSALLSTTARNLPRSASSIPSSTAAVNVTKVELSFGWLSPRPQVLRADSGVAPAPDVFAPPPPPSKKPPKVEVKHKNAAT